MTIRSSLKAASAASPKHSMNTILRVAFGIVRLASFGSGCLLLLGALWFGPRSPAFIADLLLALCLMAAGTWRDRWLSQRPQRIGATIVLVTALASLSAQIAFRTTSRTGLESAPLDLWFVDLVLIALLYARVALAGSGRAPFNGARARLGGHSSTDQEGGAASALRQEKSQP